MMEKNRITDLGTVFDHGLLYLHGSRIQGVQREGGE
jgi:hypothetical protein